MATCQNLYSTFYTNLVKDVENMLPDGPELDCFRSSVSFILTHSVSEEEQKAMIIQLAKLGKEFESAVINGRQLDIPPFFRQENNYGPSNRLPGLFRETIRHFFNDEGTRCFPYTSSKEVEETTASSELSFRFQLLRQTLLAFSKCRDLAPDVDSDDEVREFVRRTSRQRLPFDSYSPAAIDFRTETLQIARLLIKEVLYDEGRLHPSLIQWIEDPFGRHGPGAVAGGERDTAKWRFSPCSRIQSDLISGSKGDLSTFQYMDPEVPCISRLAVVPKDVTKNRLICIEPKELMFAQQGLMKILYEVISSSLLTKGAIHLFDQSHNFYAARRKGMSTIDLKDASDLLSMKLCKYLFPREAFSLLTRYRSAGIELPSGDLHTPYSSMATMGNACCFPVESLAFWSLTLGSILAQEMYLGTFKSLQQIKVILRDNPKCIVDRFPLYTFGDDIIVPDRYFLGVCETLEMSGLTVNTNKSCFSCVTPVKESCGSYWWGDYDVRIIKFPYAHVSDTLQYMSIKDQYLDERLQGFYNVAEGMFQVLLSVYPTYKATRKSLLSGLKDGWIRFNPEFQRLEAREPHLVTDTDWSFLPGDVGLYAYFTSQATRPLSLGDVQCVKWEWVPLSC